MATLHVLSRNPAFLPDLVRGGALDSALEVIHCPYTFLECKISTSRLLGHLCDALAEGNAQALLETGAPASVLPLLSFYNESVQVHVLDAVASRIYYQSI